MMFMNFIYSFDVNKTLTRVIYNPLCRITLPVSHTVLQLFFYKAEKNVELNNETQAIITVGWSPQRY